MNMEEYHERVRVFACQMLGQSNQFELFIPALISTSNEAQRCVSFRLSVAYDAELQAISCNLELGLFNDPDLERQKACWLFLADVNHAAENIRLEQICTKYLLNQPLFAGAPSLYRHIRCRETSGTPDFELIDDNALECVDDSEVYRVGTGYSKLPAELDPQIANWARKAFPNSPRFLHLNPWEFYANQPLQLLEEAALVPANPNWITSLALFPSQKTFASYILEDCSPKENMSQYRDYHLGKVRKLEVTAQRRKPDYLSMMIEELTVDDEPNGLMVARCIHLDTRAKNGTPMKQATLQHLDLAINVYKGEDRAARVAGSLQLGKVVDATYRTHLFRIENLPFPSLFCIAEMFLKSRCLISEWLDDLKINPPPSSSYFSDSKVRI